MSDFKGKEHDIVLGHRKSGGEIRATQEARSTHMHVIGSPGTGKSKFLEHLIRQDIKKGHGVCLVDPHGGLYEDIVHYCSQNPYTAKKLVLLDATADGWSFGFNPLDFRSKDPLDRSFYIDNLLRATVQSSDQDIEIMTKGLRSIYHVIAAHGLTLCEADTLLTYKDKDNIRKYLTQNIDDYHQKKVWERYDELSGRDFMSEFQSSYGKLFRFLDSARVRNIIGQTNKTLNILKCMDEGSIVLVNLSTGQDKLSRESGNLLGRFLINYIFKTALTRSKKDYELGDPKPFYLYIDECHQYITEDITSILNEARKYGLHMILAHQNLDQLDSVSKTVRSSVMGSARIKVVFGGLNPEDAETMAEVVFRGELELEEPKRILNRPVVIGEKVIWLEQESTSASWTEGRSESESYSDSEVLDSWGDPEEDNHTHTESTGSGTSASESLSVTRGRSHALQSIREERPGGTFSLEEQRHKAANTLAELTMAEAIVKVLNKKSIHFKVPYVEPTFTTDRFVQRFKEKVYKLSGCVSPTEVVEQEQRERRERLISDARKYKENPEGVEEPDSHWE